jgi:hypothetical protein
VTRDYSGEVALIAEDGTTLDRVRVFLRATRSASGLGVWGGSIERTNISPSDWMDATRIKLPNGDEANCVITEVNISHEGTQSGWLVGSGEPPF